MKSNRLGKEMHQNPLRKGETYQFTVRECKGPAAKNFREVLVHLEPVREDSKEEEEDRKALKHQPTEDTARIEDLAGRRRHQIVRSKADVKSVN